MEKANPEAFEGDPYIEAELRRLCEKWAVRTIVETGTYRGASTRALADMGSEVITIEIEPPSGEIWHLSNVRQFVGDSGAVLSKELLKLWNSGSYLFYLDAHWKEHSPLLEELGAIAAAGLQPVLAIHDFFNPGHPEYGFDHWDIGEYRLELIEPALDLIYGPGGWVHHYNQEAAGLKRGIIYVEPKEESL